MTGVCGGEAWITWCQEHLDTLLHGGPHQGLLGKAGRHAGRQAGPLPSAWPLACQPIHVPCTCILVKGDVDMLNVGIPPISPPTCQSPGPPYPPPTPAPYLSKG